MNPEQRKELAEILEQLKGLEEGLAHQIDEDAEEVSVHEAVQLRDHAALTVAIAALEAV